jgi:hypothetical protein
MSKKPVKRNTRTATAKAMNCIVLFGLGEEGKPRAARFENEDEQVLNRLAQARGLRMGVAQGLKHADLVKKLPVGRVFATGSSSVPLVPSNVYETLNTVVGGEPGQISCSFPKSRDEVAPGHLVIAQDSLANGWWEAVVVARERFYNPRRRHSTIGYLSPMEFEKQASLA